MTEKSEKLSAQGKTAPMTVGLPRALLYYRYSVLWKTFFSELGIRTAESGPTTRSLLAEGERLSVDEACLSVKIFMGHVSELMGKCDYILIPRIAGFGLRRTMCTRFQALPDLTAAVFRGSGQKFLVCNVDCDHDLDEEKAFADMGSRLGFSRKEVRKAYKAAKKAETDDLRRQIKEQETALKNGGTRILLAGHSYITEDEYVGRPVVEMLQRMGVTVIRADLTDRKNALEQSEKLSPTLKWEMNREIAGGIQANRKKADGLILLSAFPCGPDSMANEIISRRVKEIPVLNLVLDSQFSLTGIETRLESFVDIIRFKKGGQQQWNE
ncbi:MAG: acyl-CoA dehydratase activase-related protein [Emergencia sp.]